MAKRQQFRKRRGGALRKRARSGSGSIGFAIAGALLSVMAWVMFGADMPLLTGPSSEPASAPRSEPSSPPASVVVGTASVIDGDTLDIHGVRIRLSGVDAPESGQKCRNDAGDLYRCGSDAANALDAWINRNPVACTVVDIDRYGRSVSTCSVRGHDIQDWLARNGHALAYRQYSTAYVAAEDAAKTGRVGVWSGEFVPPADWRKGVRLPGEPPTKSSPAT